MTIINSFAKWLATNLDKLKITSPIAFIIIQALLGVFLGLFANDTINIPTPEIVGKVLGLIGLTDLDNFIIVLLGAVIALISPRTTFLKNSTEGTELPDGTV